MVALLKSDLITLSSFVDTASHGPGNSEMLARGPYCGSVNAGMCLVAVPVLFLIP